MAKRARTAASDPWNDDDDMPPHKFPPGIIISRKIYLTYRAAAPARLQDARDNLRLLAPPAAAPPDSLLPGLRALGLLDFVHLRLDDAPPRRDLVTALVANYKRYYEFSYARGAVVTVSLDAFARALRLPLPAPSRAHRSPARAGRRRRALRRGVVHRDVHPEAAARARATQQSEPGAGQSEARDGA